MISYIVCSNIRTGSNLLCRSLEGVGGLGEPTEHFLPSTLEALGLTNDPDGLVDYCHGLSSTGSAGSSVLATKLHWYQLDHLLTQTQMATQAAGRSGADLMHFLFPDARLVFLWRQDTAAQAVSVMMADATGAWERRVDDAETEPRAAPPKPGLVTYLKLNDWQIHLERQNDAWRSFFEQHSLAPLEVVYEDMVADFAPTVQRTVQHIAPDALVPADVAMPNRRANRVETDALLNAYRSVPQPVLKLLRPPYLARRKLRAFAAGRKPQR